MKPDFRPMLADSGNTDRRGFDDRWVAESKFDGFRAIAWRHPDGRVRLFGRPQRNGEAADNTGHLPYLDASLERLLPPDTCVDGELISPNGRAHVQSVMFTQHRHVPSRFSPALTLVMFDVLRAGSVDMRRLPWTDRRDWLERAGAGEHVALSPVLPVDHALTIALENGLEGVVYKRRDSPYVNGRSAYWRKAKFRESCEVIVVGFKPGKAGGAWDGMVGAFEVELVDKRLQPTGVRTTVKCGTDARHIEASEHPERWLGAIVEIWHLGLQPSGVPLSPQFKCRRDDLLLLEANKPAA